MKLTRLLFLSLIAVCLVSTPAMSQRGRGNRPPLTPEQQAQQAERRAAQALADGERPIDMLDTVWTEEMTWMEVRDSIAAGKTTAIIGTGGVEKNGPYTSTGKHNYVLETTTEAIARKLGNALIAPLVRLEPGNPDNPNIVPGSVYLTQETYRAVLTDMTRSLKSMGFTNIMMVGDSGGNQRGMEQVADELNREWKGEPARVFFITEYYTEDRWSYDFMKEELGIVQMPDTQSATRWDIHDDYHYESLVAVSNPRLLRETERTKAGRFSIYGVDLESTEQVIANGKKLADYRADITIAAFKKAMAEFQVPSN